MKHSSHTANRCSRASSTGPTPTSSEECRSCRPTITSARSSNGPVRPWLIWTPSTAWIACRGGRRQRAPRHAVLRSARQLGLHIGNEKHNHEDGLMSSMAPVVTNGTDSPVNEVGQWVATGLTWGLGLFVLAWIVLLCRRERTIWPLCVAVSGTLACLMEPMFDHLYGLWLNEESQWHLYTTIGSSQPVWLPAAYLTFYGGATVFIARYLARRPSMRSVWQMYGFIVVMAIVAEMTYVSILGVYEYQDSQPFVVLGYPMFLAFTNAMSALVSGILVYRLVPLLKGWGYMSLIPLVPMA